MIERIGIDADDTLWDEASWFCAVEDAFVDALVGWTGKGDIRLSLRDLHLSRLGHVGYGVSSYRMVMQEFCRRELPRDVGTQAADLADRLCDNLLAHPVEPLAGVFDALSLLSQIAETVLITKGEVAFQRSKLEASGLSSMFREIHIVENKTVDTYMRIFGPRRGRPHAAMIGNSLKSDVLPAIAAGAVGIFVPCYYETPLEVAEKPDGHPLFRECQTLSDAAIWLQQYQSRAD